MTLDSDEKHLELKVGAVILISLVLLVIFILLLSDFSFKSKKDLVVYFQNPGGLSPGAAVKVAGRKAGAVKEMTYLGQTGPLSPINNKPALVKVLVEINEDVSNSLRKDARFYITTKGMLGDPFLEIDPGMSEYPYDTKVPLFGADPPRLDLFLADTYEMIKGINNIISRNADNLDVILGGGARLVGAVDRTIEADGGMQLGRVTTIFDSIDSLVVDTRNLINGVNKRYVEDPGIARTLKSLESMTRKLDNEVEPLLADIKKALEGVERISGTFGPEEQRRIKSAVAQLDDIAHRTSKLISRGDALVMKMEKGEGTVGRMIKDEEIYDDLKELIRDIKKHPWKLIWQN